MEGYNISKNLEAELKSTSADGISGKINDTINTLGLEGQADGLKKISNLGKYFQFLQGFSDSAFAARPWSTTFQPVSTSFPYQTLLIQKEVDVALKNIANFINANVTNVMTKMKEHYQKSAKWIITEIKALASNAQADPSAIKKKFNEFMDGYN